MKKPGKAPTMKDVAREAGVALGTVSKVFNGLPVGESYRERVEAAARKLSYSVNNYARGLRANETRTVALILPSTDHAFFANLADSVCSELTRRDYRMLLAITKDDPRAEARCIQMVRQEKVDGIIGLTYSDDLEVGDDLPYVSIDRYVGPNVPCVSSANFSGGEMAAQKLIELGCRRLLFLRTGSHIPSEADKRGAGFTSACLARGVDHAARYFDDRESYDAIYRFLDRCISGDRFEYEGIFCSTDMLAYNVRKHLASRGLQVPRDVQLIGYDGIRSFNTEGDLFCSTIIQPIHEMARTAVDVLLNKEQQRKGALICLPVSYAPGGTTREGDDADEGGVPWQVNT